MSDAKHIAELFEQSIRTKRDAARDLPGRVVGAGDLMRIALRRGGKVISCGNGGSAADCQHFAAELVNRFETERGALAALALTCDSSVLTSIANDYEFDHIFARQIEALGRPDDVLLAITTSGSSRNVEMAIDAAHGVGMTVVLLSGRDGGRAARRLASDDVELRVPSDSTARIQEVHLLLLHGLCSLLDRWFKEESEE